MSSIEDQTGSDEDSQRKKPKTSQQKGKDKRARDGTVKDTEIANLQILWILAETSLKDINIETNQGVGPVFLNGVHASLLHQYDYFELHRWLDPTQDDFWDAKTSYASDLDKDQVAMRHVVDTEALDALAVGEPETNEEDSPLRYTIQALNYVLGFLVRDRIITTSADKRATGSPKVGFVKQSNLVAAITNLYDRTLHFLGANFDLIILGHDTQLGSMPAVPFSDNKTFLDTYYGFLNNLRCAQNVMTYPPMSLVQFFDNKHKRDLALGSQKLVRHVDKFPTRVGGEDWAEAAWIHVYEHCCHHFSGSPQYTQANQMLTSDYLDTHGIVLKPTVGTAGRGILFLKKESTDPSTVIARDTSGEVVTTPQAYLSAGSSLRLLSFEPYAPECRTDETRMVLYINDKGQFSTCYYVPTLLLPSGEIESFAPEKGEPTGFPVFTKELKRNLSTNTPLWLWNNPGGFMFRVDAFTTTSINNRRTTIINEIELLPHAASFIADGYHQRTQLLKMAECLVTFINKNAGKWPA